MDFTTPDRKKSQRDALASALKLPDSASTSPLRETADVGSLDGSTGLFERTSSLTSLSDLEHWHENPEDRDYEELIQSSKKIKSPSHTGPDYDTLDYELMINTKLDRSNWMTAQDDSSERKRWYGYTGKTFSRWALTYLLGITVGTIAFGIIKFSDYIANARAKILADLVEKHEDATAFVVFCLFNLALALTACLMTLYIDPKAAGSGIPEVKAYLNGVRVTGLLRARCLFVKFVGTILSVASALVVGPEGPLVHMGAIVGGMLTNGRKKIRFSFLGCNKTFSLHWDWLLRFRNDVDRRDFVSMGTAAGFAAAFGAPIGGVLFALEETSSFWSPKLMWRMMSATMLSTFTHGSEGEWGDVLNSYGLITLDGGSTIDPHDSRNLAIRILAFVLVGIWGGVFGGCFTRMWQFINPKRPKNRPWKITEVAVVSLLTSAIMFAIVLMSSNYDWGCSPCCDLDNDDSDFKCERIIMSNETRIPCAVDDVSYRFACAKGHSNQLGFVLLGSREKAIDNMLNNAGEFETIPLLLMALLFYFGMLITFGMALPQGIFMPSIMIGVSWGLLISKLWNSIPGATDDVSKYDFGLMGACAILGGIQHSSISLVVILLEGTGQARYLLPIMVTTITAKAVSSLIAEGVYEVAIELKNMPYLDLNQGERWMDNLTAKDLCIGQRVHKLLECVTVMHLLKFLESNTHNGFPVLVNNHGGASRLKGIVLRSQLYSVLEHKRFKPHIDAAARGSFAQAEFEALVVPSPQWTAEASMLVGDMDVSELQAVFEISDNDLFLWVDVAEVMNYSPYTVPIDCPLKRAVRLFCKLGLRHLMVVNEAGDNVVGVITRFLTPTFLARTDAASPGTTSSEVKRSCVGIRVRRKRHLIPQDSHKNDLDLEYKNANSPFT